MGIFVIVPLCAMTGATGFLFGALTQQDISMRKIKQTMVNDPYVYGCRARIFRALTLLGQSATPPANAEEEEKMEGVEENTNSSASSNGLTISNSSQDFGSLSIFEQFILWAQTQVHKVIMFMTYSIGPDDPPQPKRSHVAGLMKYGFPGMDELRVYKNFVVSYDRRNRIAHWVCEHLDCSCLGNRDPKTLQKPNEYIVDPRIPAMFSPSMRDFRNSDWVGGHMASPLNYKCDVDKFVESYKFPNIVPISRGLKNNVWLRLEQYVRELAVKSGSVYVYTGPLFMPQRITFRNWAIRHHVMGINTIAVPTHFFKVIISEHNQCDGLPHMEGYVVPNADVDKEMDLRSFISDIRDIEHFAGLKFYDGARSEHLNNGDPSTSQGPAS